VWICQLVEHGLVRPSFVPPKPIRELRDLTAWGARSQFLGFGGGVIAGRWFAVACCRPVGGVDGLVVRLPGATPRP
jgi:hypothetical protein